MSKTVGTACVLVIALSVSLNALLLLGGVASAAGVPRVGVVDVAKVEEALKQSSEWQQMTEQFEAQRVAFRSQMEVLSKYRYLSKDEREEVRRLTNDPSPSRDNRRRIEQLESKSYKLDREFQHLVEIARPSQKQRRRLMEIQSVRERHMELLRDGERERAQRLAQGEADLLAAQHGKVEKAAADVAREQQFELVVDRQFVLFGGQDATNEVLRRIESRR